MIIIQLTPGESNAARMLDIELTHGPNGIAFYEADSAETCAKEQRKIMRLMPENDGVARPYRSLEHKISIAAYVL